MPLLLILIWLGCFIGANAAAKVLVQHIPSPLPGFTSLISGLFLSPWFYLAGVLYLACAGLYLSLLRLLPLSVIAPVTLVLGVVATYALGVAAFGEKLSLVRGMGVALCLLGVILIYVQSGR